MSLDFKAQTEIKSIAPGKKKAFVYRAENDTMAVGHKIHAELIRDLGTIMGCAGFLERTSGNFVWIIHWPASPVDSGGRYQLPKVEKKLKALGFSAGVKR